MLLKVNTFWKWNYSAKLLWFYEGVKDGRFHLTNKITESRDKLFPDGVYENRYLFYELLNIVVELN